MKARLVALLLLPVAPGCSEAPPEGGASVMEAWIGRLDRDGDGSVDAAEYQRVAYAELPMERADRDGDGLLGAEELEQLLRTQDPAIFDVRLTEDLARRAGPPPKRGRGKGAWRRLADLLPFLDAELQAAGGEIPDLEPELLRQANESRSLASIPTQTLLIRYRTAFEAQDLPFPRGLVSTDGEPTPRAVEPAPTPTHEPTADPHPQGSP